MVPWTSLLLFQLVGLTSAFTLKPLPQPRTLQQKRTVHKALPGFLMTDLFAAEEIRSAGPQLAATQSDLALALVVLVEGVGATVTSDEAKNIVPAITGVIGAVLLAAAGLVVMGSDFTLGAYGASAVAVLLGVSYVLRLLQDDSVDESEIRELYSIDGELLPSPDEPSGSGGWPKEYIAFNLAGCFFGLATFLSATTHV